MQCDSVAEIQVGRRGDRPPTFRKIGNLSEIFGSVGILKAILNIQIFVERVTGAWGNSYVDLIIFKLFSSYMLVVLICSLFAIRFLKTGKWRNLWNFVENKGILELCPGILKSLRRRNSESQIIASHTKRFWKYFSVFVCKELNRSKRK